MSIEQASALLFEKYSKHLLRPELHLSVFLPRPIVVSVIGEVNMPGLYSLSNEFSSTENAPRIKKAVCPRL